MALQQNQASIAQPFEFNEFDEQQRLLDGLEFTDSCCKQQNSSQSLAPFSDV